MSVFKGVKIGDFQLHSGDNSPVLFDVPSMLWENRDRKYIQDTLIARMPNIGFDAIVGIEFGGALLATLLSGWYADKKLGFYRKDGTIVISWPPPLKVILIDDVMTTGNSFKEASSALKEAGYNVVSIISLIYRSDCD